MPEKVNKAAYLFDGDKVFINGLWCNIRDVLSEMSSAEFAELAKARALDYFEKTNVFCGRCASPMELAQDPEIAYAKHCSNKSCEGYKKFTYPSFSVAAIIAVSRKNNSELLFGHNCAWPQNRVSLLAGFMQAGETLENCVRREIMEEAGLRLKTVKYICTQPWPFPSNIMVGFYASAIDMQARPDGREIDKLYWLSRAELKNINNSVAANGLFMPKKGSLARYLTDMWLEDKL